MILFNFLSPIAKSILQQSEESSLKDESKRLLEYFIEYMLELEQDKVTSEPYRVCRRVNILRDYPDDKIKIYP